jgi:hypothetical protein
MSDLEVVLKEFNAPLQVMWRMPELFNAADGTPAIKRITPQMSGGAGKHNYYELNFEWSRPFNASAGAPGHDGSPTFSTGALYAKRIFATCEIDPIVRGTEAAIANAKNEITAKLDHTTRNVMPTLGMHHFWLDGTGRRARCALASHNADGVSTRVWLKPMWTQDALPGCLDATKYIEPEMWVDFITYDETTNSGVGSGARVTNATALRVRTVHRGTVAYVNGTEDSAYIDVDKITADISDVTTWFVALENPAGVVDGEPQGVMRWIGDGYNANRATTATHPAFGFRNYAGLDKQNAAYERFVSYIYNRSQSNPVATVTVSPQIMDAWLGEFYLRAPKGTSLDCLVSHTNVRWAIKKAFDTAHSALYTDVMEIPDLGYRGPVYTDPHTGRTIPWYFTADCPRQSTFGFHFEPMAQADLNPGDWAGGDPGISPWRDMRNITKELLWRATWEHDGFLVQHMPSTSTAMFFINETP